MKNKKNVQYIVALDLQLFAEGGASGTGDGGQTGENGTAAVSQKGAKSNPLAEMKYGIQPEEKPAAEALQTNEKALEVSEEERNTAFEKMIKGEYKDLFDSKVQNIVKNRIKGTKEVAERFEKLSPVLDMLAQKYGVEADDIDGILKAVEKDDDWLEDEAMRQGMTVDELRTKRKTDLEITQLRKQIEQINVQKAYDALLAQAEQLKTVYPSFDLNTELQNNAVFKELLRNPNIDLRKAYEATHLEEVMRAAMQMTAKTVGKRTADTIMANGSRPSENGSSAQGASLVKSDVSKLSKADRQEIIRRVAQGEKIRF